MKKLNQDFRNIKKLRILFKKQLLKVEEMHGKLSAYCETIYEENKAKSEYEELENKYRNSKDNLPGDIERIDREFTEINDWKEPIEKDLEISEAEYHKLEKKIELLNSKIKEYSDKENKERKEAYEIEKSMNWFIKLIWKGKYETAKKLVESSNRMADEYLNEAQKIKNELSLEQNNFENAKKDMRSIQKNCLKSKRNLML